MNPARSEWLALGPSVSALGAPLELVLDGGGDRWHLAGEPVHAGQALELLCEDRRWCECREGDACDRCDGARELVKPWWLPVRFEYRNGRGGPESRALLYLPLHVATGRRPSLELTPAAGAGLRLRWPSSGGAR